MSDTDDYIQSLQDGMQEQKTKNAQLTQAISSSMYQGQQDNNLIEYQLETAELLERIEHFLKGDVLKSDEQGNQFYETPDDDTLILFNKYGVNSIMSIIGNYIDKNTILSNYDEERINEILADLGEALINYIFCNYEKMGMDTEFKKSRFNLIIVNIVHGIESTYRRAIRGKALEEINSSRIFTQSESMMPRGSMDKRKFNLFKPRTW